MNMLIFTPRLISYELETHKLLISFNRLNRAQLQLWARIQFLLLEILHIFRQYINFLSIR